MASNQLSHNKIISIIRDISILNKQVSSFGYGQIHDFNSDNSVIFPAIFVESGPVRVSSSGNGYGEEVSEFNIYCLDRINKGDSNYQDILSDTKYILQTLLAEIDGHQYFRELGLALDGDQLIEPYVEQTDENVNGWIWTLGLRQSFRYTPCNVPISPITGFTVSLNSNITEYRLIGATGPQGPQGPAGEVGATGPQGLTSISSSNVITALGYTPYDSANPSGYITSSSLSSYVPNTRTLTINGTTYDLSSNRSWTISTGTTYTFSTGLTNTAGTITSNLATGISGGQSVIGGTASGNNLTLSSTSNSTKGKIVFGTSVYDEVNNSLGIGTTNPVGILDIYKSDNANPLLMRIWNGGSGGAKLRFVSETGGTAQHQWTTDKFLAAIAANNTIGMQFRVGLNATEAALDASTRMTITTNGKVGIGTNSPSVGDFGSTFTVKGTGSEIGIITAQRNVSAVANGTGFQTVLNNASSNPVTYSYFNGYIITNTAGAESGGLMFFTRNAGTLGARMTILNDGNTGIGTTSPTAYLHLKAGTATANTAPLKFTSGTNLTTPENGAFEFDGTNLYFTVGGVRKIVTLT